MKLQFGSIIVNGAGKINGHQIRNFRGMPFLTKKAMPTISNFFLANPAKKVTTLAFRYWTTLDEATRNEWEVIASGIPFFDRWKNVKYFTGRELVTYLYINTSNARISFPDSKAFDSTIPSFETLRVDVKVTSQTCEVVNFNNIGGAMCLVFIRKNPTSIRQLKARELKLIGAFDISILSSSDLYNEIIATGFVFTPDQTYSFGIKNISDSGMASPMQVFQVLASSG